LVSNWPSSSQFDKDEYLAMVEKIPESQWHHVQHDLDNGIQEMLKAGDIAMKDYLNSYLSER